jgi:ABC-type multidrug transport system ATPase subunit
MRLYALIDSFNRGFRKEEHDDIVLTFLEEITNAEEAREYLTIFDFYHRDYLKKELNFKSISSFSVKIIAVASEINTELPKSIKILLFLSLIEGMIFRGKISRTAKDILGTIARIFHFTAIEFTDFIALFVQEETLKNHPVLIASAHNDTIGNIRAFIHVHELQGEIHFLYNESSRSIFFRNVKDHDHLTRNGKLIKKNRVYPLNRGGIIRSFKIEPIYYSSIAKQFLTEQKSSIVLEAKSLKYVFKDGVTGIYPVDFSAESGQMIAIMGNSGTGKTTLMNVLNGNLMPTSGKVLLNQNSIHSGGKNIKSHIGYIPQDDLLIEELTVYQNLYFSAKLCFKDLPDHDIHARTKKTLKNLDLLNISHLRVGDPLKKVISGGQRKRLNIALELIREPSMLLIDEPTSGLSSTDAERVIDLIKDQTLRGKIAIVNIHQPSSSIFKLFDKLLVLDQNGRTVYYGHPIDSIIYFKTVTNQINASQGECLACGNVNPEQVLEIIEKSTLDEEGFYTNQRKNSSKKWYRLYKENISGKIYRERKLTGLPEKAFQTPGLLQQFNVFFKRTLLSKLPDKQFMLISLLEAPLLAFLLAFTTKYFHRVNSTAEYIYSQNMNIPAFFLMSVIVALFLGLMVSAEQIIKDRKIIKREAFLNLSWFSYINSKIGFLFIISGIQMLLFTLPGISVLAIKNFTFPLWIMLFSLACNANILGLLISSSLKNMVSIYITIPILLVPQLMLNGSLINFDELHKSVAAEKNVPFIGNIMVARWAYEGLMIRNFKYNEYNRHFYPIEEKESKMLYLQNYFLPEVQSLVDEIRNDIVKNNSQADSKIILLNNSLEEIGSTIRVGTQNFSTFEHTAVMRKKIKEEIQNLKQQSIKKINNYIAEKDSLYQQLIKQYGSADNVINLKKAHHNQRVEDILLAREDGAKIMKLKDKLIRKYEPVYKLPESKLGNAHFFSGFKRIGNYFIDTFWFNIIVIWLFTSLLYLLLYFKVIEKSFAFLSKKNKHL